VASIDAAARIEDTPMATETRQPETTHRDAGEWQRSGNREAPVTPRAGALAAMYEQAAALASAGDLAGARALHEAIGKLLGTGRAVGDVVELGSHRPRSPSGHG
jgi:hypothetical protein